MADRSHAELLEAIAPQCRSGDATARRAQGWYTTPEEAHAHSITAEDRHGNARADELAGAAASVRLPAPTLLAQRQAALEDLAAAQSVLAAVELVAI